MSDDDRDYGIGNDRKRRAEHYDMRKKRREDMDEAFREMLRALPRYLLKGLTKATKRAEHNYMEKKRREEMAKAFREMKEAIPGSFFKGITRVSQKTILEKAIEFAIFKKENGQLLKEKRIRLEAECKQLEELSDQISEKIAKGEKEAAKKLYEQHIHLFESDSSEDDSSEDSSDEEDNDSNEEFSQVEIMEEQPSDSDEETDD